MRVAEPPDEILDGFARQGTADENEMRGTAGSDVGENGAVAELHRPAQGDVVSGALPVESLGDGLESEDIPRGGLAVLESGPPGDEDTGIWICLDLVGDEHRALRTLDGCRGPGHLPMTVPRSS